MPRPDERLRSDYQRATGPLLDQYGWPIRKESGMTRRQRLELLAAVLAGLVILLIALSVVR